MAADGSLIFDTKIDQSGFKKGTASLSSVLAKLKNSLAGVRKNMTSVFSANFGRSKLKTSLTDTQAMMRSIARTAAAAFSVKAVASYAKECKEAYDTQIEAETKLATIMRQRMGASDAVVDSIKELASEQQKLGVIGDEVQLAGAQQAATFLKDADSIKTLLPAMNDLLAQQRGLEASTSDAVNVANMMGKVMQGQTSALKRVGISFSEAEEHVLKYGTEAERAAMLSQVIVNNVGHMNAALAQTDAGRQKQLANTMGDVKEQFGQAATQIQLAFLPALQRLAGWLSNIASIAQSAGAAIRRAFGDESAAVTQTAVSSGTLASNYADIADDAERAADAQKASLASFDKITKLSEEASTTTPDEAAVSIPGVGTVSEAAEAGKNKLFDSLLSGDYEKVGDQLAGKINTIFNKAKKAIDTARPKISKGITGFTTIFNTLVDKVNWDDIGTTFGKGFNLIVDSITEFLDKINWKNLGSKLSTGLNGFIAKVNWKNLGSLIGKRMKAVLDFLSGAVETFNWEGLGQAIADFINGLHSSFSFEKVGETAAKTLNGIFKALHKIITKTDFKGWAKDLTEGLNKFIDKTDWKKIGTTIGDAFTGAIDFLYTAIDTFDEKKAAKALYDMFNNFITNVNWGELGTAISTGIKKALNFLAETIEGINWDKAGESIADFLNGIDFGGIFRAILRMLTAIIKGLPALLKGLVTNMDFETAVGVVGSAFGFKFLGKIKDFFTSDGKAKGLFGDIKDTLSGKLSDGADTEGGIGGSLGSKICAGVAAFMGGWKIGSLIREKWGPQIDEALAGVWDSLGVGPDAKTDKEINFLSDKARYNLKNNTNYSNTQYAMIRMFDQMGEAVEKKSKEIGKNTVENFKASVELEVKQGGSPTGALLNNVNKLFDSCVSKAKAAGESTASSYVSGVKSTADRKWEAEQAAAKRLAKAATQPLKDASTTAKTAGKDISNKLADGIENRSWYAKNAAASAASIVKGKFSVLPGLATTWGNDLIKNMAASLVTQFAKNTIKGAVATVAGIIADNVGFSEPKEGPLSDFHTFMPDMLQLMAKGIKDNKHLAIDALTDVVGDMSDIVQHTELPALPITAQGKYIPASVSAPRPAQDPGSYTLPIRQAVLEAMVEYGSVGGQPRQPVIVYTTIDGKVIGKAVIDDINNRTRLNGQSPLV